MKAIAAALLLAAFSVTAVAQSSHYVRPHVNKDGTYVEGHRQTNPDGNRMNNWSTHGNLNPYTGQAGTVNPYSAPQTRYAVPSYTPAPNPYAPPPNPYAPKF